VVWIRFKYKSIWILRFTIALVVSQTETTFNRLVEEALVLIVNVDGACANGDDIQKTTEKEDTLTNTRC
jgi:hypothetical protein